MFQASHRSRALRAPKESCASFLVPRDDFDSPAGHHVAIGSRIARSEGLSGAPHDGGGGVAQTIDQRTDLSVKGWSAAAPEPVSIAEP
jgi:hypothetical protein